MPASKAYSRVNWKDYPNKSTKIMADNLNRMDEGIDNLDDRVVSALNSLDTVSGKQLTDEANILALQGNVGNIESNLNGFTFYSAGEVNLVAYVADDSFYTDANGKYVLADSPTGQTLLEDTTTYKVLASTEETHGEAGADTCSPFSVKGNSGLFYKSDIKVYKSLTGSEFTNNDNGITINSRLSSSTYNGNIILKSLEIKNYNKIKFSISSVSSYKANDVTIAVYDEDRTQNIFSETLSVSTTSVSKNYDVALNGAKNISIRVSITMSPSGQSHSNTTNITDVYTE